MNKNTLTLGSLFSGSGGFELAGILSGIQPVWNSEIEPFAIRVTTKRLPGVKHFGNVSQLSGHDLPPVDIVTFGSPCQDMSVAGNRAGLDAERSGLFHQAIRIIKEMREETNGEKPRYCVWENVPGAFSSNGGADFKSVLQAVIGVKEPSCEVPAPGKNGWPYADVYLGDGWSVAYRLLDAQHWGVPQRRKRIYLVADFDGERAGNILFKSEGLSGYTAEGFRAWQRAAGSTERSAGETGLICLNDQAGRAYSLRLDNTSASPVAGEDLSPTIRTGAGPNGTANVAVALNCRNWHVDAGVSGTLQAKSTGGHSLNYVNPVFSSSKASFFTDAADDMANTLVATDYKDPPIVNDKAYGFYPQMKAEGMAVTGEVSGTLVNGTNPGYQNGVIGTEYIVRRLTPTECARLQGFPDWWTSSLGTPEPMEEEIRYWEEVFEVHRKATGNKAKPKTRNQIVKWLKDPYSDSAAYRLWGNGVALPCVWFVLAGIVWAHEMHNKDK